MLDFNELPEMTAVGLGAEIQKGNLCPVELIEFVLERIENYEDQNIFITVTRDRALKEAEEARLRIAEGRPASILDGVPIAWKDNVDIAGAPTTVGSDLFANAPAAHSDQIAANRVMKSGMVCVGKLNMTELAFSALGLNPHFGTPKNPNDRRAHRSPGGSSSGSGVAVAAGLVPCAIGSDTGGSVRIPAAFNGVVGYKSSEALIETSGVYPLSRTLDTLGPLARSVTDCIFVSQLMRGVQTEQLTPVTPEKISIIVPTNLVLDDLDSAVAQNFESSVEMLERSGVKIRRAPLDALTEVTEISSRHGTLAAAEAYHEFHEIVEGPLVDRVDPRVVLRIMAGKRMSAFDVIEIQQVRHRLIQAVCHELNADLIAMPTVPIVAPKIAPLDSDQDLFMETNQLVLRNTSLGNFLNLCGLALPNGTDKTGMPTSLLISAPGGHDERLLASGLTINAILRNECVPEICDA